MIGINCQLIVLSLFNNRISRQLSHGGRIHLDAYMWTLDDKPTASLSATI